MPGKAFAPEVNPSSSLCTWKSLFMKNHRIIRRPMKQWKSTVPYFRKMKLHKRKKHFCPQEYNDAEAYKSINRNPVIKYKRMAAIG